ncbi:MFS transporter [Natrinema hispanicum]|uniref:MFS transporter n=1 Tax=Natrinema hispanicum TaxID=392421 RepID=UPI0015875926|nr:MFS transporter [Natrinema hispanicum]
MANTRLTRLRHTIRDLFDARGVPAADQRLIGYTTGAHALDHLVILSIPLFIPIWIAEFQVTTYELGLLVTLMTGLYGAMALPSGILSDRFGADTVITGFLLLTGGVFLAVPFIDSFAALAVVVALAGVGAGFYHPPALAFISREAEAPSKGFAYHGIGANLGIGIGPLLITAGLAVSDWRTVLGLLAVPLLGFGVLFALRGPSDSNDHTASTHSLGDVLSQLRALVTPVFLGIIAVYVFAGIYYRGTLTFLPQFIDTLSSLPSLDLAGASVGAGQWLYSLILLTGSVGQIAGGHLGERFEIERVLLGVFAATSLALLALGGLSGTAVIGVGLVFGALLFTLAPLQSSLVAKHTPDAGQGIGFGLVFTVNFGIGALGASLAGWLLSSSSYSLLFGVLAVFPLVAAAAVLSVSKTGRPPESHAQ